MCKKNVQENAGARAVDFVFLDSGSGGIPYMLCLKEKSPASRCVYIADTKNFPYGKKTAEQIIEASCAATVSALHRFTPKAFVIGCNTISVTALEELRRRFAPFFFVGTVPAVKQAALITKNRRIGLLATQRTVDEPYTAELTNCCAPGCTLVSRADPDLIDFIERDFFTASQTEIEQAVSPALDFFLRSDVDTVVLGCTHFLHVAEVMQRKAGGRIRFVDSKEGVVNQALRVARLFHADCSQDTASCRKSEEKTATTRFSCAAQENDLSLFITGPASIDEKSYKTLCCRLHLLYGGIL